MSGIYRIDLGNGWFYIGSAVNVDKRKRNHRNQLKSVNHSNIKMQNCWNKYGVFEFTVLEECEIQELLLREQIQIDRHFADPKNTNLAPTAGSKLGTICSSETKDKISAANKGKVCSAETREKLSAAKKGQIRSDETRLKISDSLTGRLRSAGHSANNASARKGGVRSDETRAKMAAAWVIRKARAA